MRATTELAICAAAAVYIAFFSWPVPKMIRDIYHTGLGRFVVLASIIYLAKYQSIPLAILLSIYYTKAARAAYHETFESGDSKKKEEKEEKKEEERDPTRKTASGSTPAHKGSSSGAVPKEDSKTEHYQNFATF